MLKGVKHFGNKSVQHFINGGKVTEAQRVGAAKSAHSKANDELYNRARDDAGGVELEDLSNRSNSTRTDLEVARRNAGDD